MKSKIVILIFFTFIAYLGSAQTRVTSFLVTNGINDTTYGTHYDTLGYGGYRVVQNITQR